MQNVVIKESYQCRGEGGGVMDQINTQSQRGDCCSTGVIIVPGFSTFTAAQVTIFILNYMSLLYRSNIVCN
jgi:hypothetical protein